MGFLSSHCTADAIGSALCGGLLLGSAVMFKTSVLSGVLGISNYTKRLMVQAEAKRYCFIIGMVLAGLIMSHTYGATEPLPPAAIAGTQRGELYARLAIGSFLVGVGATMQHGCTSGHGLTGLARLSLRSWVAVPTFMAAGAITATLSNTAASFPPDPRVEVEVPEWYIGAAVAGSLACILVAVAVALWYVGQRGSERAVSVALLLGEFTVGVAFGCGLVISGMARPSKVAAFLDLGSGAWDMSLAFVMGGALLVTVPYFQALDRLRLQQRSFLHAEHMDLPSTSGKRPDRQLIMGAVCFGSGWGTCGMCPGPVWVNVGGTPSWEVFVALLGLLLGIVSFETVPRLLTPKQAAPASNESAALELHELPEPKDSE